MSVIGPVQSHCHECSQVGKRSLRWEGFVEKVRFERGVKEWWMMRAGMMREMGWQVDEEKRWIETRMVRLAEWIWKLIPKTRWCISNERSVIFKEEMVGGRGERVTTYKERWWAMMPRLYASTAISHKMAHFLKFLIFYDFLILLRTRRKRNVIWTDSGKYSVWFWRTLDESRPRGSSASTYQRTWHVNVDSYNGVLCVTVREVSVMAYTTAGWCTRPRLLIPYRHHLLDSFIWSCYHHNIISAGNILR